MKISMNDEDTREIRPSLRKSHEWEQASSRTLVGLAALAKKGSILLGENSSPIPPESTSATRSSGSCTRSGTRRMAQRRGSTASAGNRRRHPAAGQQQRRSSASAALPTNSARAGVESQIQPSRNSRRQSLSFIDSSHSSSSSKSLPANRVRQVRRSMRKYSSLSQIASTGRICNEPAYGRGSVRLCMLYGSPASGTEEEEAEGVGRCHNPTSRNVTDEFSHPKEENKKKIQSTSASRKHSRNERTLASDNEHDANDSEDLDASWSYCPQKGHFVLRAKTGAAVRKDDDDDTKNDKKKRSKSPREQSVREVLTLPEPKNVRHRSSISQTRRSRIQTKGDNNRQHDHGSSGSRK